MSELQVNCIRDLKLRIAELYISTVGLINSRVPEFTLNQTEVDRLTRLAIDQPRHHDSWPQHIRVLYNIKEFPMLDVALYKDVAVGMFIDGNNTWIKFPTVTSTGSMLSRYEARQWRWCSTRRRGYGPERLTPEPWEGVAFAQNRVPTLDEFFQNCNGRQYNSWVHTHNKNELHTTRIALDTPEQLDLLASEIPLAYNKYVKSLARSAKFDTSSKASCYKAYLTYRAKPMFATRAPTLKAK